MSRCQWLTLFHCISLWMLPSFLTNCRLEMSRVRFCDNLSIIYFIAKFNSQKGINLICFSSENRFEILPNYCSLRMIFQKCWTDCKKKGISVSWHQHEWKNRSNCLFFCFMRSEKDQESIVRSYKTFFLRFPIFADKLECLLLYII